MVNCNFYVIIVFNNNFMDNNSILGTEQLQNYIKLIRKKPLITNERLKEIDELLKLDLDSETRKRIYNELIEGNLRFVITIAKKYHSKNIDIMDLISEGNIGLIKATERYKPDSEFKFISYAVWWIKQHIISYLNDYARTIRIPSNLVQLNLKNKKEEILNEYENDINDILHYFISFYSDNNDDINLIDFIFEKDYGVINEPDITLNNKINKLLNVLDEREKTIIKKYYGFNNIESNLEVLGEEFSCTKERIRQIKDKAILKLRNESYEFIKM